LYIKFENKENAFKTNVYNLNKTYDHSLTSKFERCPELGPKTMLVALSILE
jgi:hypothetical protein